MEIWSPYCEICCDIRIDVSAKLITADPTVKKLGNNISSWWRSSQGLLTCTGRMRSVAALHMENEYKGFLCAKAC